MEKTFNEWYEKNYASLSGYGIWLRGGELNTCEPHEFESSEYRILISRLSSYRDTSDSITHKVLYQIAKNITGTYVDLAFLPPPRDAVAFDRDCVPWMLGTSSKRDALQFDVLAISNSIVQELINLPLMLERSNIPSTKKSRMERSDVPLIILGGANALNTSLLLGDDPLVDGIFTGEDAGLIEEIFEICKGLKCGRSKIDILEELSEIAGFFQPDVRKETFKYSASKLSTKNLLKDAPVFYDEEQPGRGKLQISDGCACFCSFCSESWGRKPYREFSEKELIEHAISMKVSMGLDSVELYSFNFNMYSGFYPLIWDLHSTFTSVGLKSQRFDFIADNHELPRIIHAAGKSSITCGLEGISSRLRAYLNKSLTEKNLQSALNILLRSPIRELKIFLIATGLENEQDYDEFRDLLNYISDIMESAGRKPRVIFSMTPLVRFPFTPLEFEIAPSLSVYKDVIKQVERLAKCRGFEFRSSSEISEYAISQILTRANSPMVMDALRDVCLKSGFVYYEEITEQFIDDFKKALEIRGLSFDDLLSGKSWDLKFRIPVKTAVNPMFLSKVKSDCTEFRDSGYCMGNLEYEGSCLGCQACLDDSVRKNITAVREKSPFTHEMLKSKIKNNRSETVSYNFRISIPHGKRGIHQNLISMALARVLMLKDNLLAQGYRGFAGSRVQGRYMWPWVTGLDIISLNWSLNASEILKEKMQDQVFLNTINTELRGWCEVLGITDLDQQSAATELTIKSEFPFDGEKWLKDQALKYTKQKNTSGEYCYIFNAQSLKKKVISSLAEIKENNGIHKLRITPDEKFDLFNFLKCAYKLPEENDIVRINVECSKI